MSIYAYVDEGFVRQIFDAGDDPITKYFHPDMLWLNVDAFPGIQENWIAEQVDGEWTFHPYVQPEPTPADILLMNQRIQESFMNQASLAMTPVLLALQLQDATDEESAKAREWQTYWRDLQDVDLSVSEPAWPETPLA